MASNPHGTQYTGYEGCAPQPVAIEQRGCFSTIWNSCSKTYVPSVLTLLIFLLATALLIIAMICEDISIPRLLTGIVGMIVYLVSAFSIYFDFARENQAPPDGNQDLLMARVKKFLYAKVKFHGIISWLAIVMVLTLPIVDDDVLTIELLVTFLLMGAVCIIGASVPPPDTGVRV
ncbi:unnamed protein product [Caenorhabditis brenneri]